MYLNMQDLLFDIKTIKIPIYGTKALRQQN